MALDEQGSPPQNQNSSFPKGETILPHRPKASSVTSTRAQLTAEDLLLNFRPRKRLRALESPTRGAAGVVQNAEANPPTHLSLRKDANSQAHSANQIIDLTQDDGEFIHGCEVVNLVSDDEDYQPSPQIPYGPPTEKSRAPSISYVSSSSQKASSPPFHGGHDQLISPEAKPNARLRKPRNDDSLPALHNADSPQKIRQKPANDTKTTDAAEDCEKRRARFLRDHQERFLPLLPAENFISSLPSKDHLRQQAYGSEQTSSADGNLNECYASVPYAELTSQPKNISVSLKPYQLTGLAHLVWFHKNGMSGILGDEMGLGKTLTALSLLQYIKENSANEETERRPSLVICPLSVLRVWVDQARQFTPKLKVLVLHGLHDKRNATKEAVKRYYKGKGPERCDLLVTTYETFVSEKMFFKRSVQWQYTILDEAHKVKNDESCTFSALYGLKTLRWLLMTGSPLQNNLCELWSLLHLIYPDVFIKKTQQKFKNSFDLTRGLSDSQVITHTRRLLELIMIRRIKEEVDLQLPTKRVVHIFVPLSPFQRECYIQTLIQAKDLLIEDVHNLSTSPGEEDATAAFAKQRVTTMVVNPMSRTLAAQSLANTLVRLRQICSHPYLVYEPSSNPSSSSSDHLIRASSKFTVLSKIIQEHVLREGHKIIIFSEFLEVLDHVEELLGLIGAANSKCKSLRIEGNTKTAKRNLNVRLFQDTHSPYRIMLISIRAGGLGMTLTAASEVVLMEEDWNPQVTLQAEARAHRIGQTKEMTVYKLGTAGTVEEQMRPRIQKKLYLATKITESMENIHAEESHDATSGFDNADIMDTKKMTSSQLMAVIANATKTLEIPAAEVDEIQKLDFQALLGQYGHDPEESIGQETAVCNESEWLSGIERVDTCHFEGLKYHREKKRNGEAPKLQELDRHARRVGKERTVLIDGIPVLKDSLQEDPDVAPNKGKATKDFRTTTCNEFFGHEKNCHVCKNEGELTKCTQCPRAYHESCVVTNPGPQRRRYQCPQHKCKICGKKTLEAGGLLYRCHSCEYAFCEDCVDDNLGEFVGENLTAFEQLGYFQSDHFFFVQCSKCQAKSSPTTLLSSRAGGSMSREGFCNTLPPAQSTSPSGSSSQAFSSPVVPPLSSAEMSPTSSTTTPPSSAATESSIGSLKRKFTHMEDADIELRNGFQRRMSSLYGEDWKKAMDGKQNEKRSLLVQNNDILARDRNECASERPW